MLRRFATSLLLVASALPASALPTSAFAQVTSPPVTGQAGTVSTSPYLTISQNVLRGPEFTTLASALAVAGLDRALSAVGEFTVFAPTNAGFARLPADVVGQLMQPENRTLLAYILRIHVVMGRIDTDDLARRIRNGGGAARLETLSGQPVVARLEGTNIVLNDPNGNSVRVIAPAQTQANGMLLAVDGLLLPKPGSQ